MSRRPLAEVVKARAATMAQLRRGGTGAVRQREPAPILARPSGPGCSCGARKLRCDECAEWYCNAPGHAGHLCQAAFMPGGAA